MEIDVITQYILAIVPAFTAVVGMVITLGVGIGKIRKANALTEEKVERTTKGTVAHQEKLERELTSVHKENAALKKDLDKVMKKIQHIHFDDSAEV